MIVWKKPNDNEIETNEEKATVEHCKSLGWKQKEEKEEKKRGRPRKEEENVIG